MVSVFVALVDVRVRTRHTEHRSEGAGDEFESMYNHVPLALPRGALRAAHQSSVAFGCTGRITLVKLDWSGMTNMPCGAVVASV